MLCLVGGGGGGLPCLARGAFARRGGGGGSGFHRLCLIHLLPRRLMVCAARAWHHAAAVGALFESSVINVKKIQPASS